MRHLLSIWGFTLTLLSSLSCSAYEKPFIDKRDFSFRGHLSGIFYHTNKNNMVINTSLDNFPTSEGGEVWVNAGLLTSYRSKHLTLRHYATTEGLFDFGFVDLMLSDRGDFGVRLGRVNRVSGFFSGMGPQSDHMNFLPQGSSPLRFDDTFFRFDGVQFYISHPIDFDTHISFDITYGQPKVEDITGIFDPTFFEIFQKEQFRVDTNRGTTFIHFGIKKRDWQIFFDYISANINFDALFRKELNYSDIDPTVSEQLDFTSQYEELVKVSRYPIRVIKAGIGKSFDDSELLISFFEQYGRMPDNSGFSLFGQSLGNKFKPMGASILWRGHATPKDIVYVGASTYQGDLTSEKLSHFGYEVSNSADKQYSLLAGYSVKIGDRLRVINEVIYNIGTATLSATYQSPQEGSKNWWVYSLSGSLVF